MKICSVLIPFFHIVEFSIVASSEQGRANQRYRVTVMASLVIEKAHFWEVCEELPLTPFRPCPRQNIVTPG